MKLLINKPVEVNAKYLEIFCGGRLDYDEFTLTYENGDEEVYEDLFKLLENYPSLENERCPDELYFKIDIDTGEVVNFPKGRSMDCYDWKIVDEGTYSVLDSNGNIIVSYRGYVPEFLGPHGYGDYFEFEIENGFIKNWKFTQEDFNEILNYND